MLCYFAKQESKFTSFIIPPLLPKTLYLNSFARTKKLQIIAKIPQNVRKKVRLSQARRIAAQVHQGRCLVNIIISVARCHSGVTTSPWVSNSSLVRSEATSMSGSPWCRQASSTSLDQRPGLGRATSVTMLSEGQVSGESYYNIDMEEIFYLTSRP